MGLLETPAAALAWTGRQGTRAVALSVFAGLALPWLAAAAKPAFTPSLFVLLCLAFLRVRLADLRGHVRRPGLLLAVQPQSRSHDRGGRRRRSRAYLALCRDGAVSHLPAAVPAGAGADAIQGMTLGGLPTGRTYTLIATDCPVVWEARSCAWCWMMRSRKLLAAALVPALPAAGLVMVICE